MGVLCINIAIPCLSISSIGATVHATQLAEVWDLLLWSLGGIVVGGLLAFATSRWFLCLSTEVEAAFILAGAFGNNASLPILMMATLCTQKVVLRRMDDADTCVTTSYAYLMVYVSVFSFCLYGIALPLLRRTVRQSQRASAHSAAQRNELDKGTIPIEDNTATITCMRELEEPPVSADSQPSTLLEQAQPSDSAGLDREKVLDERDSFLIRIDEMLGFAPVALPRAMATQTSLELESVKGLAGSAASVDACAEEKPHVSKGEEVLPQPETSPRCDAAESKNILSNVSDDESIFLAISHALRTPPVAAPMVGLIVGLIRPLSDAMFRSQGFFAAGGKALRRLGDMGVGLSVILMAAALVYRPQPATPASKLTVSPPGAVVVVEMKAKAKSSEDSATLTPKTVAALCFLRLVALPAVGMVLCRAAVLSGAFEPTSLGGLRALLIMVEWGTPSAQMVVVAMGTLQYHGLAQRLAAVYLIM